MIVLFVFHNKETYAHDDFEKKVLNDFEVEQNYSYKSNLESNSDSINKVKYVIEDKELKSLERLEDFWNLKNSKKYDSPEKAVEMLKENGYIGKSYYLIDKKIRDDRGIVVYCFAKRLDYEIINEYDSIKVMIDYKKNNIIGFNKFENNIKVVKPNITKEEATDIAKEYLRKKGYKFEPQNIDLRVKKTNNFFSDSDKILESSYRVVYCLSNQELAIYIDVEDGNVLGGDATEGKGKAYYINESGRFRKERATILSKLMYKLGFDSYADWFSTDSTMFRNDVLKFLRDKNSDAFTYSGHGSTTKIGTFNGDSGTVNRDQVRDVPNILSFVFLDGGNTASTNSWSNAFGIYTPPIKFIGDRTWNGRP